MENLHILNSKEKKNILKHLKDQFGCDLDEDYVFFINPKNRIFVLSGDFSKIDSGSLRINSLGLYFGELYNEELRLSLDGAQLIGRYAKRNIIEVDDEQAGRWMKGEDFEIDSELNGFVIVKNNSDFLGCGKVSGRKLYNYVPKERRI